MLPVSPDRLPVQGQWSRKHAHTQRRLCERFAAPVIDAVVCQDIKTGHMQKILNAAPTPGKGKRVQGMISALAGAGLEGGYLANPRLAKVHWQAGDHPMPAPRMIVAGESALWVDPAEVWQPGRDRSNSRSSDPSCARTRFRPPTSTPRPVEPGNPTLSR